jgi:hypothetical protein
MKIVIDNYATSEDTQPLYFQNTLLSLGYESVLCDSKRDSTYDIFDKNNPDIYITHGYRITKDLIHYIVNNTCSTDILINIQEINNNEVLSISELFNNNNVNSSFFFLNTDNKNIPTIKDRNIINICSAADMNLLNQKNTMQYSINKAIMLTNKDSIKTYEGSYHNISMSESMKDVVDIVLPELLLAPLYSCYKNVIFRDFHGHIPQAFFDAIIFGCNVYFDIDDIQNRNNMNNLITKILKPKQSLDFNNEDKLEDFTELQNFVIEKHTNNNRVKTLLSNIRTRK